ncbi:MAG TPA: flippase [Candidatus Aquilonibacter sp.]|nr:flippase [Candidatus Aquilonibacter sp.]
MAESQTNVVNEAESGAGAADVPLLQRADLRGEIVQNTMANIVGRAFALVFSTLAAALLARYLGSEKLGEYGAIYAYLGLFSWMATFGFEPVIVREASRDRKRASDLVRTAAVLSIFLSVGTVAVAVLVAPWAGYAGRLRDLLILAGLEYVLTPLRLFAVIFQVDLRQWYGSTINVVRQGIWFAIIVVLWALGAPLSWVICGRVVAALIESTLIWAYGRRFLAEKGKFLRERAWTIFSHSFPLALTSLLGMIYLRIDQVMLHKMTSDSVLGQYVAAVRVSELFEMLPAALMFTLAPILAVSVADPARFRRYIDQTFRFFMLGASGLCVFMTVGAPIIVRVLYGKQFLSAAPLLAVLIWSEVAVFFSAVVVNVMIATNQQSLLPIPTLAGAAINVALNLALIPKYAAMGSAWATLVSYSVAWMAVPFFFKRTRSATWQGLRFALPVAAIALLAVKCATLAPISVLPGIGLALAVFIVGTLITRCLKASDVKLLSGMVKSTLEKRMA